MRSPINLGKYQGTNNIIGQGYGLCVRDGIWLLAVLFGLLFLGYLALTGMAPEKV